MQENLDKYQPQQGFPEKNPAPNQALQVKRRESAMPFGTYLKLWAEQIIVEQAKLRQLTEMAVVLHRRYRGLTLSDQFSRYGTRRETRGVFLEYDPELDGEIHPINIVQPAIRANTNACLQSNAEINIESANASAKHKQIADRWQRVANYFERTSASEDERTFLFDAVQKEGVCLKYVYPEKSGNAAQTIPVTNQRSAMIAAFTCESCEASGMREVSADEIPNDLQEGYQNIECPSCKGAAHGLIKNLDRIDLSEQIKDLVDIKKKLYTSFNFVIDAYGAKKKGIDSARWLQIHEPVSRAEMETMYPHINFGSPSGWSYQLQAEYALAQQDWSLLNYRYTGGAAFKEFDLFERRQIFLHEDAYSNYVAPEDFEFTNGKGVKVFSIKKGQTIAEALEAQYGDNPKGFKFVWCDDRLIDIVSPEDEPVNFRECMSAVHWLRDSSGFHSSPNYSIVIIQDDITLLNTMNHNITAANASEQVVYNSLVWEESDFNKQYLGTKNAAHLDGGDITKSVFKIPSATPSPYLSNQLQFLWQIKDNVSQVTPAMRGESQKGETFGAQRQQLEQAYGGLTSVLKSEAQSKVRETKQKCAIAKKSWTLEQFQRVSAMFNELWTDEDVQEMCETDFEADLIFDYVQGSEMPQSNLAREMKFFQGLSELLPFVQANPQLVAQDKMQAILAKIDEFADFDFDLTGLEIDEIISQKRFLEFADVCAEYAEMSAAQIEQMRQQIVSQSVTGTDATGQPILEQITALDVMLEQIFHQVDVRFSKYENLDEQGRFFTERLRAELGKTKPNQILIEVLTNVLGMIEQAVMQISQEAQAAQMANDPQMQMQLQAAEEAKNKESADKENERAAGDAEKDKDFERKILEKNADHNSDVEKMQLQHAMDWQNKNAQQPEIK